MPGGFLGVVEGIDGAGKSTLLPALAECVRAEGFECVLSREPTDGPWGRKLRESAVTGRLDSASELELFLMDRREHVSQLICPALEAGKVVLLDRYYFSTAAYQGARGADPEAILRANEAFAPAPALILLLDLEPKAGLQRVRERGDRPNEFEREGELERARAIFRELAQPGLVRIDAGEGVEEVRRLALAALRAGLAKGCAT